MRLEILDGELLGELGTAVVCGDDEAGSVNLDITVRNPRSRVAILDRAIALLTHAREALVLEDTAEPGGFALREDEEAGT